MTEPTKNVSMDKKIRKLAIRSYFREGDDVSQRIDWGLIFHGILLEAFFATHKLWRAKVAIGSLGATTAWLWLFIGMRQTWQMRHLIQSITELPADADALQVFHRRLTLIRTEREPLLFSWVRAAPTFAIIIPAATLLTWAVVTVTAFERPDFWIPITSITASIAVASLASWRLADRPKLPPDVLWKLVRDE